MLVTWYVTEGGDAVDPAECRRKDGVLVHKSGAKIAMRSPDCPRSRSVEVGAERPKKPAPKKNEPFAGKGDHDGDGKVGGAAKPKPEVLTEQPAPDSVAAQTSDMEAETPPPPTRGRPYKTRDGKAD